MYECRNCGGELRFDIPSQKLKCSHCDGVFDPDSYDRDLFAEADKFEVNVFRCPNCGGQISSTNLSAVEYCPYCGRFSMPASVKTEEKMPDGIMPFEVTADEAKAAFKSYIGGNFYAPSRLKNDTFLNGFRGMYLPFWSYDISFTKKPKIKKVYSEQSGGYIIKDTYEFTGDLDASYKGVAFDASSRFEDGLSRQALPYRDDKVRPFNPSYMFGFYGETADIGPELYEEEAVEVATQDVFRQIDEAFPEDDLELPENKFRRASALGAAADSARCVMAPVWFLTWRHHDNVVYSIVNGQTGKAYSDIPVSITKFLIGTILMTIPLFALFYFLLPTPSIYTMLVLVAVTGLLSLLLYRNVSLEHFILREHLRDRGYLDRHPSPYDPEEYVKENADLLKKLKNIDISTTIWTAVILVCCFGGNVMSIVTSLTRRQLRLVICLAIVAVMAFLMYSIFKSAAVTSRSQTALDIAGAAAAILIAFLVILVNPVEDAVYYVAAILVICGVLWTLMRLIRQYNTIATHPDPHFFEGRDAA